MNRTEKIYANFKTVNGKYTLSDRVGNGTFGEVFIGIDSKTGNKVAIKFESKKQFSYQTQPKEARILDIMKGHEGFATQEKIIEEQGYNIIIMNLLGPNLEKIYKFCNNTFSIKTIMMMAIDMISLIERLHNKGILHRDIKPENFVVGSQDSSSQIFLIDFGLSKQYKNSEGQHILPKECNGLIGTARYASINAHLGKELSRRDDLESIGYTLIYFAIGKLPWQDVNGKTKKEKYEQILTKKRNISQQDQCSDLQKSLQIYLTYVKNLNFTETPKYNRLKKIFTDGQSKMGYKYDKNFDWLQRNNHNQDKKVIDKKSSPKEVPNLRNLIGDNKYYQNNNDKDYDCKSISSPVSNLSLEFDKPKDGLKKQGEVKLPINRKNMNILNLKKDEKRNKKEKFKEINDLNRRRSTSFKIKIPKKNLKKYSFNDLRDSSQNFTMNNSKYLNHTQQKNEADMLSILNNNSKFNSSLIKRMSQYSNDTPVNITNPDSRRNSSPNRIMNNVGKSLFQTQNKATSLSKSKLQDDFTAKNNFVAYKTQVSANFTDLRKNVLEKMQPNLKQKFQNIYAIDQEYESCSITDNNFSDNKQEENLSVDGIAEFTYKDELHDKLKILDEMNQKQTKFLINSR